MQHFAARTAPAALLCVLVSEGGLGRAEHDSAKPAASTTIESRFGTPGAPHPSTAATGAADRGTPHDPSSAWLAPGAPARFAVDARPPGGYRPNRSPHRRRSRGSSNGAREPSPEPRKRSAAKRPAHTAGPAIARIPRRVPMPSRS